MKLKGKCAAERLRSRWEQQAGKGVMQKEDRTWEETENKELWEHRDGLTTQINMEIFKEKDDVHIISSLNESLN